MKASLMTFSATILSASFLTAAPEVIDKSVTMSQDAGSGRVTISYRLSESAIVTADIQTNASGNVWVSIGGVNCCDLIGDVNRYVTSLDQSEIHSFTWQPRTNWPGHEINASKCRAVVTAWSKSDPPNYMAVDLSGTSEKLFFADAEHLPGRLGATNRLYMTEKLLLRRIPAAYVSWQMGSRSTDRGRVAADEAQRTVMLTKDYYMGVFMVTQYQHFRILDPNSFYASNIVTINPITKMSFATEPKIGINYTSLRGNNWPDEKEPAAGKYLIKWRERTSIPGLDIPTEAQWEYACRAGSPASWNNGYDRSNNSFWVYDEKIAQVCWYNNSKKKIFQGIEPNNTVPVGLLKPNDWGLYDMHGNFWEFCRDWYVAEALYGGIDPEGSPTPAADKFRVGRGGRSGFRSDHTRSATRYGFHSDYGNGGYRLMCPVDRIFAE